MVPPRERGGSPGRDPFSEAVAAPLAGCEAGLPGESAGQGGAGPPRPPSRPVAAAPGGFKWERVRWGWGPYL